MCYALGAMRVTGMAEYVERTRRPFHDNVESTGSSGNAPRARVARPAAGKKKAAFEGGDLR